MRKRPAQLVQPLNGHTQEVLRILGVPSGKDRTLADQRAKKVDPTAGKPKVLEGNVDDGTLAMNLANLLHSQGTIVNKGVRGGRFGDELKNVTLVNANSPLHLFYTQGASDTASTTNVAPAATVVAASNAVTLGVGKWAVIALASIVLSHSTGATVGVSAEIEGVEGTLRQVATAAAPGVRCEAHLSLVDEADWIQGEQTLNVRARFQSVTAGTTSAKNPSISIVAKRME